MSDQHNNHRQDLRDISHLFLSSVRDKAMNGAAKPNRVPPGKKMDVSIDLTPEEFARICSGTPADTLLNPVRKVPVTAILASHLNGTQFDRVKQYARSLSSRVGRIGLIELDASEFRLMSFEPASPDEAELHGDSGLGESTPTEGYDLSQVADAINELHCDVEQWLVLLPSPRTPEAKALLRDIRQWTLLTTCDHDGVVSCYRTLKGLADLHTPGETPDHMGVPALSLAALGESDGEADKVYEKLSSVCKQFLRWPVAREPRVGGHVDAIEEHLIMCVRPSRDKAQLASATQWEIVGKFLNTIQEPLAVKANGITMNDTMQHPSSDTSRHLADIPMSEPKSTVAVSMHEPIHEPMYSMQELRAVSTPATPTTPTNAAPDMSTPVYKMPTPTATSDVLDEVVELAGSDASPGAILSSIVRHEAGGLIECPIRPPMCPDARLAVDRQRGLVLLGVSRTGLTDLKLIGQAYRWLCENRPLISMAVPQMSIDAHQFPRLRLFVDGSDLSSEVLQPLLHSGNVTVQAYRKLRWGAKTGLLLAAA